MKHNRTSAQPWLTLNTVRTLTITLLLLLACLHVPAAAQPLPFYDGFDDGDYDGWTVTDDPEPQSGPSVWEVSEGVLVQTSNIWAYGPVELETKYHLGTHITAGDETWADYAMNALVRSADNDGVGLIVRYQDAKNYYRVLLMNDPAWSGRDSAGVPVNTPLQRIQKFVDGEPYILAENKVSEAYPSGFFSLTADVRGDTIRAFLNGEMILYALDSEYGAGSVGMLSYANVGAYYDSVSVMQERQVYAAPSREINYPVRAARAPYIQRPTRTSVEIAWRTLDEQVGTVRYGREKGRLDQAVTEHGPRRKHHVKLAGLTPSSRYYYEVRGDGEKRYGEEDVRTARRHDETQFSFLVLGDSGVDTPTQQAVADQMRRSMNESEIDFVVHVGDVHQGSGDAYDDVYFKPYRELIKHVNVFTALGNHDVITDDGAVYLDDFYLPHNNPDSTERYYSFRWANAYFICLDTNIDYRPGSPQHDFLLTALSDSLWQSAEWTFVYAHHPPYSEYWTDYYGEQDVQDHLVPIFEQYDVDMVLNGHTHSYERGEKEHVHYLVSGGGGGSLDDYFVDYDHISFSDAVHHFTRIDVDGDELAVTAIDQDGQRVDRFTINKHTSVALEADDAPGEFVLAQNYPNPFQAETQITYGLAEAAQVRLALYDMLGREVMLLLDRRQPPGTYTVRFNPKGLASGRYVYKLTTGAHSRSRQLVLAR